MATTDVVEKKWRAVHRPDPHSKSPMLAHRRTFQFADLPTEIRWQIYGLLTTSIKGEGEHLRDHCKCGYDYSQDDEGISRGWVARCACSGERQAWLDSAFPDTRIMRQDGMTLVNLFKELPSLGPDGRLLGILCYEQAVTPRCQHVVEHLRHTASFLHIARCRDTQIKVAIDIGTLDEGTMASLLDFLDTVGRREVGLKLALRMTWPSLARGLYSQHATPPKSYAKLRRLLQHTGRALEDQGSWLKVFIEYHWCCIDIDRPLPAPCGAYDLKLVSTVPFEDLCGECTDAMFSTGPTYRLHDFPLLA